MPTVSLGIQRPGLATTLVMQGAQYNELLRMVGGSAYGNPLPTQSPTDTRPAETPPPPAMSKPAPANAQRVANSQVMRPSINTPGTLDSSPSGFTRASASGMSAGAASCVQNIQFVSVHNDYKEAVFFDLAIEPHDPAVSATLRSAKFVGRENLGPDETRNFSVQVEACNAAVHFWITNLRFGSSDSGPIAIP